MARGRGGSGPYTKDAPQVGVRLEPELDEALSQLAQGNGMGRPEMARLLMRRGILAVSGDGAAGARPELSREQAAARGEYAVEQLSELLARFEQTDPIGAVVLARGVEASARGWADSRATTHGIGLSRDQRLADLLDSLVVLVRTAPPADQVPLWTAVLGAVTARSREDYEALTGDRIGQES